MRFMQCMSMRNGAHFYEEAHLKTLRDYMVSVNELMVIEEIHESFHFILILYTNGSDTVYGKSLSYNVCMIPTALQIDI